MRVKFRNQVASNAHVLKVWSPAGGITESWLDHEEANYILSSSIHVLVLNGILGTRTSWEEADSREPALRGYVLPLFLHVLPSPHSAGRSAVVFDQSQVQSNRAWS